MRVYMHTKSAFHAHRGASSEVSRLHEHGDVMHVALNVAEFYAVLIVALVGIAIVLT